MVASRATSLRVVHLDLFERGARAVVRISTFSLLPTMSGASGEPVRSDDVT